MNSLHDELAKKYFDEFAASLRKIGMSGEDIARAVTVWIEEIRKNEVMTDE